MEQSVGQKLLQQMKDIEQTLKEANVPFRFGYLYVGRFDAHKSEVESFLNTLEDAGFQPKVEKEGAIKIKTRLTHEMLKDFYVNVEHRASEQEELEELLNKQKTIQEQIEKLQKNQEEAV